MCTRSNLPSRRGELALATSQTLVKAFVGLPGGDAAVYEPGGLAYYQRVDWVGSARLDTSSTGGVNYDGAYAAYGENYAQIGTYDHEFAGMPQQQVTTGSYTLQDALFRNYNPVWGRWLSPDPAGLAAANPMNPQSWNRYAYATNNPVTLVDPKGLDGTAYCNGDVYNCPDPDAVEQAFDGYFSDNGMSNPDPMAEGEANYEQQYCVSCWEIFGRDFANLDSYYEWATDPDGGESVLQAYEVAKKYGPAGQAIVTAIFDVMCGVQQCDPSKAYVINYQFKNGVYNVTFLNQSLDTSNLTQAFSMGWLDAVIFHHGDPSWYSAAFDGAVHLVASSPMTGHYDPYGPLDPLHGIIQFPLSCLS